MVLGGIALFVCGRITYAQDNKPTASTKPFDTRDLSGTWMGLRFGGNIILDGQQGGPGQKPAAPAGPGQGPPLPMTAWAQAKFDAYQKLGDDRYKMDPRRDCFPLGMPRDMYEPVPLEILQSPDQVVILLENDHINRHIFLNMTEHPKDLSPTWMGHSIGHWEGDTLVVDTVALHGETFLDGAGHPHTGQLHLIERIKRVDANTLDDTVTVDDPGAYTKQFSIQKTYQLKPGWHVMEYVCEDEWSDKLKKYYPDGYFNGDGAK